MAFRRVIGVGWEDDKMLSFEIEPGILQQPNIPKPLHGLNPRRIMGDAWWNTMRKIAYASTDNRCLSCGVHKSDALFYHWLEAHEIYNIDYKKGLATFTRIVPLCPACHKFIHNGLLYVDLKRGKISSGDFWCILEHGTGLLTENYLDQNKFVINIIRRLKEEGAKVPSWANALQRNFGEVTFSDGTVPWSKWRLDFNGKLYSPLYKSYDEWLDQFAVGE